MRKRGEILNRFDLFLLTLRTDFLDVFAIDLDLLLMCVDFFTITIIRMLLPIAAKIKTYY